MPASIIASKIYKTIIKYALLIPHDELLLLLHFFCGLQQEFEVLI